MASLRLSELYTSVQCEGINTGIMTQFVRFAGCNMTCPGWPCDTEHAIVPALYLNDSTKPSALELAQQVQSRAVEHLCITGGEPFLQPAAQLQEFIETVADMGHKVEFFTNGSFVFPDWAMQHGKFMMDWKLAGSGEANTATLNRAINLKKLRKWDGIKFVVTNAADLMEAYDVYQLFKDQTEAQFWVGAAWDTEITNQDIIDYVIKMQLPWRLNVQIHKFLWPVDERGV